MQVTLFVGSQSINILLLMTSHGSWFAEELKVLKRKNPELFPFFPATILTLKNHIHAPIHPPILHVQPERLIADYVNLLKLQKKRGKKWKLPNIPKCFKYPEKRAGWQDNR